MFFPRENPREGRDLDEYSPAHRVQPQQKQDLGCPALCTLSR